MTNTIYCQSGATFKFEIVRISYYFQISMAVCSLLYQLATRPAEQEKLYQELLTVLPTADTPLTTANLDKMNYLKAFIKEVFR